MRYLCLVISSFLIYTAAFAQSINFNARPLYVPFSFDSKTGLTDTLGNEFVAPGKYYIPTPTNFYYYIIGEDGKDNKTSYWFMNAATGKKIDLGSLADNEPVYKSGDTLFYHCIKNQKSTLASPYTNTVYSFDKIYNDIEYFKMYDLAGAASRSVFITQDKNYDKEIWHLDGSRVVKASQIAKEYKIEPVRTVIDTGYTYRSYFTGLAVRTPKPVKKAAPPKTVTAKRKPGSKLPPPILPPLPREESFSPSQEDSMYANIYNYELKLIGTTYATKPSLTKLMKQKSMLSDQVPALVSAGRGIIKMTGDDYSTDLNDEFAIKKLTKKVGNGVYRESYFFVQKKDGTINEITPLRESSVYWAYHASYKLLNFSFYDYKRMEAYFDYNGEVLPKSKLIIPRKYIEEVQLKDMYPFILK